MAIKTGADGFETTKNDYRRVSSSIDFFLADCLSVC
jgi:hypothetical protein